MLSVEAASRVVSFSLPNESTQRRQHRTDKFRTSSWVVARRGNNLSFRVNLDSALDEGQNMSLQVSPFAIFDSTAVNVNHVGGGVYDITARLQYDAPLGTSSVGVRLSNRGGVSNLGKQIFILCDPWNPLDITHYPVSSELEEYVNNEHGITYRGTSSQIQDVRWSYSQFDHTSLLVSAYFVNKLGETSRRDPGLVARHVTAMMTEQSNRPDGMMVGKWEGGFAGGTNPSAWSGSTQVIRQYIAQGMRPVRFAQCWVFGALFQTVGRALGMPTRQVAAFDCAHEKPERQGVYTQSLARYWDRNTRSLVSDLGAQIWNFHSFNEIWLHNMKAPPPYNLPEWHTVDATPQEFSDGQFQLGPANVRAIREGKKIKFDTSFVISEVSARYHNYLVSCPFFFGRSSSLPSGCNIVQDMGPEPTFPTGSYIVAKSIRGFTQDPLTHRYHTRSDGSARHAVRAFDVSSNGNDLEKVELAMATNYIYEDEESMIDRRRPSGSVPVSTLQNRAARSRRNVMERTVESGPYSRYHSSDTGLVVGLVVPSVQPGDPIDITLNLVCKGSTKEMNDSLRSRSANRHMILNSMTDSENGQMECPERVLTSLRLVATLASHTGAPTVEIANVKANAVLHENNNHHQALRLTITDYMTTANGVRDGYVGITVFATDHSSHQNNDIIVFGNHNMGFLVPKISLQLPTEKIVKGSPVSVRLAFTNPLAMALTNVKLYINADNLGFEDQVIELGTIEPLRTIIHTHAFSTASALVGEHLYHATLVSDNLIPAIGETMLTIDETK